MDKLFGVIVLDNLISVTQKNVLGFFLRIISGWGVA